MDDDRQPAFIQHIWSFAGQAFDTGKGFFAQQPVDGAGAANDYNRAATILAKSVVCFIDVCSNFYRTLFLYKMENWHSKEEGNGENAHRKIKSRRLQESV